jgi:DNA-binding response OmpR family regulator
MHTHILVVESDLDIVVAYRMMFEDAGYVLHWAGDLRTARMLLGRAPCPDLMIFNGLVPDDATLAFCREQRAVWPLLPIILATTQPQGRAAALAAGADFVVVKPFDVADDLLTAVMKLLPVEPHPGGWAARPGGQTPA